MPCRKLAIRRSEIHPYMCDGHHPLILPPLIPGPVCVGCRRLTTLVLLLHLSLSVPLPPLILHPSPSSSSILFVQTSLCLYISFALSLSLSQFPRPLSLSFSYSLSLFLSSFHAALGLPKRLGLNRENLLGYNELGEKQWGGGEKGGSEG